MTHHAPPAVPAAASPDAARGTALVPVRAAVAPLHTEARVSSPQSSQALAGQLLLVHETLGDWRRAAGADGYLGWVHRGYLGDERPVDAGATAPLEARWAAAGTVAVVGAAEPRAGSLALGCTVRTADGAARSLPLGAWVLDAVTGGEAPYERVVEGSAVAAAERAHRFPRDPRAIAASAAALFVGASYQWGGVTPWGVDCSGLVQSVFRLHGVELPRDAWQQGLEGEPVEGPPAALRAGDLLFFSDRDDGRVTHVGIALGGGWMAHSSLARGGFAVERLDAAGDPVVARLLAQERGVRRVV